MLKFKRETNFKQTEIGKVPRDWGIEKLERLCEITSSKRVYFKEYVSFGIPFYRGKEIILLSKGENIVNPLYISFEKYKELKNKYGVPQAGDLLLSAIGTIGYIYRVRKSDKFYFKDGNILWIKNFVKRTNSLYLKYVLPLMLKIQELTIGSSQEALTIDKLKDLITLLPPPPEQSRIATVLSWFDDLIENKKRQNEILEKTAMAIFKSWFVDFEPFKNEEFIYSEELNREVPKGWEVKLIGEVAKFVKGLSYRSNELVDNPTEGEIFITLKIFERGGGFRPEYKYYKGNRYSNEQVVYDGDLVVALTDMTHDAKVVGAPALVILPPNKDKGIVSLDAAKLNIPQLMKEYVYLYLRDSQEENSTFANGVNVLHLNLELFKTGKYILIPPQPILEKFHHLVEPLFQKITLNQKQIMVLRKIKDALLPQLVFGKLRVEEI